MSGGPAQTHGQDGRATADIRTLPTFARGGFTLAEVLAALLLMAIVIPVALEGMSVISRAAVLGQRKVAAMRVAEGVLNEQLLLLSQGEVVENSASGVVTDGGTDFPWTLQSEAWAQDAMTQLTVRVTFTVRGAQYEMKASTLFDPTADTPGTPGKAPVAAGAS
jgi:prepilin-type N-terminal cleavage/methylation domain-containing protein